MTEFVIVVEVDNKRALAAYRKGLADLDLIWPQVLAGVERMDRSANQKLEAYEAWSERNRRNQGAYEPPPAHVEAVMRKLRDGSFIRNANRDLYISIRDELRNLAGVADVALGPYRMTDRQVREMLGWEDGSRIERIKADIGRQA